MPCAFSSFSSLCGGDFNRRLSANHIAMRRIEEKNINPDTQFLCTRHFIACSDQKLNKKCQSPKHPPNVARAVQFIPSDLRAALGMPSFLRVPICASCKEAHKRDLHTAK